MHPRDLVGGRYRVEGVLGSGTFSVVWRALDTVTGETVALKVGRPAFGRSTAEAQAARELRREADILRQLRHPNIVRVRETGEHDGRPYVVMDYLQGASLRAMLRAEGRLDEAMVVRVGTAVARALDAAHRRGVVHNDVKPENIVVVDGEPVLVDFGVARDLNATLAPDEAAVVSGTLPYLAPELLTGGRASASSDLYALAATLFECATGSAPRQELVAMEHGVSRPLMAVLRRGLSALPQARFSTAAEFAERLGTDVQPTLRVAVASPRDPQTRGRRRWAITALGGLMVAAAAGTFLLGNELLRPGGEAVEADPGASTRAATPTMTPEPTATPMPEPTPTPEPDSSVLDDVTSTVGETLAGAGRLIGEAIERTERETVEGLGSAREGLGALAERTGEEVDGWVGRFGLE